MALVFKDRVRVTSTTTGTGTITLGSAVSGFQDFSVIGNGNTTYYSITDQAGNWEVGIGTYTSSGSSLSRDTVLESSNSNSLVNFPSGTKNVFVTYPADKSVAIDATGSIIVPNALVTKDILESATITAAAPSATTNFDVVTQAVQYYTTNANTNFTFNIRGNSTTTLNTVMAIGQSCTIALLVTNGATPYYPNALQVDGVSVTAKWQGGTAPTAGNASSVDIYSFTVIKTGNAAFTVFASQTKFA